MRRARGLVATVLGVIAALSTHAEEQTNGAVSAEASLEVAPSLCIVTRLQPACAMDFTLSWRAPRADRYCLSAEPDESPLGCWHAREGKARDSREVSSSFDYWLAEQQRSARRLAEFRVKVLSARSQDRRRDRRSRHVWSIL